MLRGAAVLGSPGVGSYLAVLRRVVGAGGVLGVGVCVGGLSVDRGGQGRQGRGQSRQGAPR